MSLLNYVKSKKQGERKLLQLHVESDGFTSDNVTINVDEFSIRGVVISSSESIITLELDVNDFISNFGDDNDIDDIIEIMRILEADLSSGNRIIG